MAFEFGSREWLDDLLRKAAEARRQPVGLLDPRSFALQSAAGNGGQTMAPATIPGRRAELRSYTPTLRERAENAISSVTGDNREAMRNAKQIVGSLEYTPLGLPSAAYDAGRAIGTGIRAWEKRPWTGAGQMGAGVLGMALAAGPGRGGMKHLLGQGSWESVPGRTTKHLPGLADSPPEVRAEHLRGVRDILTDEKGRDRFSVGFGLPTENSISGPGVFEGNINPGVQTQVRLRRDPSGTGVNPDSNNAMNAVEGTRAALLGQDAFAWHVPGPLGEAIKRSEILDIDLKGTIGDQQMEEVIAALQERFGAGVLNRIAPVPTPNGFRMLNIGSIKPNDFVTAGRGIAKQLSGAKPRQRARVGGNYVPNDWERNPLGQEYVKLLDHPEFQEAFDVQAPVLARKLAEWDREFAGRTGMSGESEVQKLRKIVADEGYDGLMKAIKKGAVSVAAVGALLGAITAGRSDNGGS